MRSAHIAALLVCLFSASQTHAAFTVSISSGTAATGSATQLEVTVTSDTPGGELLDLFGLELRINRVSGMGALRFADPQSSAELSRSDYVFGSDHANPAPPPPLGNVLITTNTSTNDTYIGGDGTLSGTGATVGPVPRLLAVLDLDTSYAVAGDKYQISVIGSAFTFFFDPALNSVDSSAGTGTLDIGSTGVTPTPAPPGLVLALTGAICLSAPGLFRRHCRFLKSNSR
ncbi:hypothetical protein J8F10_05785 [Gemmata sp. G18]|uniref:PEP-CTERM sorting domain-containing protein n=1 Tax=Gemmata palustris TaxID=2822762 RepID=A0ABS5BM72_9BACT|nr:hypothetical protein [Gemmata palustris]MBP3954791.1 hypothetical protein [Gemmata palustris]